MQAYCMKSCGICSCVDKDADCPGLAKKGYCERGDTGTKQNKDWMSSNCAKSCGRCTLQDPHCKDNPNGAWNDKSLPCKKYGFRKDRKNQTYCLYSFYSRECPETCAACPA